jgi:cell division protein FtsW
MKRLDFILLAFLVCLQIGALLLAPPAWQASRIAVTLKPGESITLGGRELAAPQAETRQLTLRRDRLGSWFASNAGTQRQPVIRTAAHDTGMGQTGLKPGMQLQIGPERAVVRQATETAIAFDLLGATWQYDGAALRRNGEVQPACPGASLQHRLTGFWNSIAPTAMQVARPALLGGNLHCGNRIGIAHTEPSSAALRRAVDGQLVLVTAPGQVVRVSDGENLPWRDAGMAEHRLADAKALIIGRTLLSVRLDGPVLELLPRRHTALFREPVVPLPEQLKWTWQERQLWTSSTGSGTGGFAAALAAMTGMAVLAALGSLVAGGAAMVRPTSALLLAAAACLTAGACSFLATRGGQPIPVALSLLSGAAACALIIEAGRGTVLAVSAALLAALGLLVQLEMGLGAIETSWLRHVQKTAALLSIGVGGGLLLALAIRQRKQPWSQLQLELLLAGLGLVALCGLALQVMFGDETGVFDLQPVEFAKLALAALTAHCLALGLGWQTQGAAAAELRLRWLRLTAPALLFIALLGFALVHVNDFSPLILLAVWLFAMLFAYAAVSQRKVLTATLCGVMVTACLALGWIRSSGAEHLGNTGFYGDRFQVWIDPALHPHTGQQFLLGAKAIAEGGWRGADGWFGLAHLGEAAGDVMHVPAVQDDFAPAFLLNRHGLAPALGLWVLQFTFLAALVGAAISAHGRAANARNYRQAWLDRWRCFALAGGAAFVAGHLLLSWGTNLSIFPIMGQPMSFLSSGGSHLLLFLCPLLALGVVSTQSNEEKSSCQSMSNAKCSAK